MEYIHQISGEFLSLDLLERILMEGYKVILSEEGRQRILDCREYLDAKLQQEGEVYYGINTGFGALCDIRIPSRDLEELQHNLIRSHAAGAGAEVPQEIVRLMLLLKAQSLSYGYSGVRLELVEGLLHLYNEGVHPVVYQLGSLGASGDLAPLAHLCLPLIGEGEVNYLGQKRNAEEVMRSLAWPVQTLQAKEGLALLNGTQFSNAYACWALMKGRKLLAWANACAALSLDAFNGRYEPLDALIHTIRPHAGQVQVARNLRAWLKGSEMEENEKPQVQDPYAFRCVPQVHGASAQALQHVLQVVETEINAVTDNPNIFIDEDKILSGGNFHAQPLALAMDYLAIALAELGSISERRVFQLLSGARQLPLFLSKSPGLQSGLMIAQYTAASIVSQNKQLCTPASVDSIVSSNGQEDHVSMAANAATKLFQVVENLERLLAIEWMTATQAMAFRRPLRSSPALEALINRYRGEVAPLMDDRILQKDTEKTITFMRKQELAL